MKTSTVLKKALNVLEGGRVVDGRVIAPAWTKDTMARNKYRHSVLPTNPNAVKFCAYGAICNVLNENEPKEWGNNFSPVFKDAESYLKSELPVSNFTYWGTSIDLFNDNAQSFDEVRDLFKRAIKAAKHDGN